MFTPDRHTPNDPFEAKFSRAFESRLDWSSELGLSPRPSPPLDDDRDVSQEEAQRKQQEDQEERNREPENPLAHSTSLIEVIHDDEDHIDIEEEEAAYRAFDLVRPTFASRLPVFDAHQFARTSRTTQRLAFLPEIPAPNFRPPALDLDHRRLSSPMISG